MARLLLSLIVLTFQACASPGSVHELRGDWELEARIAESCCCDVICPCVVGGSPTHGMCVGNRLVRFESARYEGEDLAGIEVVVTFHIGSWTRLWFDEDIHGPRRDSAVALLRAAGGFVYGDLLSVQSVPLEVDWGPDLLSYSTPTTRTVIEPVLGRDETPVRLENLRGFDDYLQYRSRVVAHGPPGEEGAFEHAGTNGFSARVRRSGNGLAPSGSPE